MTKMAEKRAADLQARAEAAEAAMRKLAEHERDIMWTTTPFPHRCCASCGCDVFAAVDAVEAADRERDDARAGAAALREALELYVKWNGGASHHIDDCPGACEEHTMLSMVEAALASTEGRDELERRQRAEARVASLSADAAVEVANRERDAALAEVERLRAEISAMESVIAEAREPHGGLVMALADLDHLRRGGL